MALFGKKKEEKNEETPCCCCVGEQTANETASTCCGESVDGICCIKVLGSGCKACHQLYDNTVKAVEGMLCIWNYVPAAYKILIELIYYYIKDILHKKYLHYKCVTSY